MLCSWNSENQQWRRLVKKRRGLNAPQRVANPPLLQRMKLAKAEMVPWLPKHPQRRERGVEIDRQTVVDRE
jgi:hypothetical protein